MFPPAGQVLRQSSKKFRGPSLSKNTKREFRTLLIALMPSRARVRLGLVIPMATSTVHSGARKEQTHPRTKNEQENGGMMVCRAAERGLPSALRVA